MPLIFGLIFIGISLGSTCIFIDSLQEYVKDLHTAYTARMMINLIYIIFSAICMMQSMTLIFIVFLTF